MAIYDRNKSTKNELDASNRTDDSAKSPTEVASSSEPQPQIKTDEKSGQDVAALNANGPGTDKLHQEAAAKQAGEEVPDGAYIVAEGHSITSQRGILGPGTAVSPKDVSGGDERLQELAKSGTLVRKGEQPKTPQGQ